METASAAVRLKEDAAPQRLAFEEIYDRYFSRIYNYIWYMVRDQQRTEDLASVVFEKVLVNLGRFDVDKGLLSHWLFSIARNAVRDELRRRRYPTPISLDAIPERESHFPGPEDALVRQETVERVKQAVAGLGNRENQVIALKFGAGLSNREIGRLCRLREGNVAVILHRTIRRLRKDLLDGEGEA